MLPGQLDDTRIEEPVPDTAWPTNLAKAGRQCDSSFGGSSVAW